MYYFLTSLCLWNGKFDFSLTSFGIYICIHSWTLHYLSCCNWIEVCCIPCPSRKSWGSFKTILDVVWYYPQKFCTFVNMGKQFGFLRPVVKIFQLFYLDSIITAKIMFQIFVILILTGLLFELMVMTLIWVPLDESPVFILYEDWLLGLIILKYWTTLVGLSSFIGLVNELQWCYGFWLDDYGILWF